MKKTLHKDAYRIVNLIFAGIVVCIIVYSLFFGAPGRHYPVPSGSEILTGKYSASTGLSRSFSAILRFRFHEANRLNIYGIRIFSFFLIQLVLRLTVFYVLPAVSDAWRNRIAIADAGISIALFMILFWPFIKALSLIFLPVR